MARQFDALEVALELIAAVGPVLDRVAQRDRDLASQLRRATASVPSNISEGAQRRGADRLYHYRIAAGSAAEARTALAIAQSWRYVEPQSLQAPLALLDRVLAMLWRLTHSR
jgi:four helix bundle protein